MTHLEYVKWLLNFHADLIKRIDESNNKAVMLMSKSAPPEEANT